MYINPNPNPKAFHFVGKTLRDGRKIPRKGAWLKESGTLKMCAKGLHASAHPFDALTYAPDFTLCYVELRGKTLMQSDKVCAAERKIIARIDAKALCLQFAREVASDVLYLWDAPEVVKDFLKSGDNAKAAAAYAYADYAAEIAKYRGWFLERVTAEFANQGVTL
jgi:hypothetical protein